MPVPLLKYVLLGYGPILSKDGTAFPDNIAITVSRDTNAPLSQVNIWVDFIKLHRGDTVLKF